MKHWKARLGGSTTGPSNKIKPSGKAPLTFCKEHTLPSIILARHTCPKFCTIIVCSEGKQNTAREEIPNVLHCHRRATDSGQHMRHIMLQACSQAHNIKNNRKSDGCLEHFVFYIGLKGNHNSNTAYHQL